MNNEILMCGTEPIGQLYKDTKAEAISIAPIEVSPTESSHNVGTHIMYGGIRYKVTSSISVGDTLTIGENIVAENIESNIMYSDGTSVKDKIDYLNDGRVVLYIPANTYSKYSEALTAMQTEFDKLTLAEKRRSIIELNDSLVASVFMINNGRFTYSLVSTNANYIVTFSLDTHAYYVSTTGANSTTFQDNSESAQTYSLRLMVI